MDLNQSTTRLKADLKKLLVQFETNKKPEDLRDKQFFESVKRDTSAIFDLLESWQDESLNLLKQRKLRVHPHQILSTKENMDLIIMHSYYLDVKYKRYMELYYSINYVFDILLEDISMDHESENER